MSSYFSGFSDLIEKYVSYQKASDSWSENGNGLNIKYFDRYCALYYPGQLLCQEMVDEWCRKRETDTNTSCRTRTGVIRSFIHYLRERELTTVEPALAPKPEGRTYIPHSFTEEELRRFFHECDRIIPLRPELKYKMKKITCPVFFRLLYSSGIRTTEARYLKREDVDLEHGVLNIQKSKGYDQHYVALHESMTELLKQYDRAAESIRPNRTYFFETPNGKFYSRQWVTQTFQCLWEKANGKQNKAVAYDLSYQNLNKLQTFGFHSSRVCNGQLIKTTHRPNIHTFHDFSWNNSFHKPHTDSYTAMFFHSQDTAFSSAALSSASSSTYLKLLFSFFLSVLFALLLYQACQKALQNYV